MLLIRVYKSSFYIPEFNNLSISYSSKFKFFRSFYDSTFEAYSMNFKLSYGIDNEGKVSIFYFYKGLILGIFSSSTASFFGSSKN